MAREDLTTIVSRALTDAEYRAQLLSNPEAALKDYQLSEAEMKMIRNLNAEAFDELTMDLESRQSKSGFLGGLSLMGGKDAVDAKTILDLLTKKYGA
ncbi:MAG TPA: Os1348 family NHLP clan protein [Aggregatilineaceae bacterium]|nr:Os1348 family NHLP clan protein [Aggregatilineaceae bacterium]